MKASYLVPMFILVPALSGCAAKWINEPSPGLVALVNDMTIDGYECRAGMSSIICTQSEPVRLKENAICTGNDGCVEQGYSLIYHEYTIREGRGAPIVTHRVVKRRATD